MNLQSVEEGFRRYEVDGRTIECEVQCSVCPFLSDCKASDKESLKYRPDVRSFGAELHERSTILPFIQSGSELLSRKLYQVLIEMLIADRLKIRKNAFDIAKTLGIPTYLVRKRIQYLVDHHFVRVNKKGTYEFSFGRNVNGLIKYYTAEFETRFGRKPRVGPEDAGALSPLVKEYSDSDLRGIVSAFLQLEDPFLKDCGYSLRFLPMKINRILIDLAKKIPQSSGTLTRHQLEEYIEGKTKGLWTGEEDWAKAYENAIKAVQVPA